MATTGGEAVVCMAMHDLGPSVTDRKRMFVRQRAWAARRGSGGWLDASKRQVAAIRP